jgi:hypothetical protein
MDLPANRASILAKLLGFILSKFATWTPGPCRQGISSCHGEFILQPKAYENVRPHFLDIPRSESSRVDDIFIFTSPPQANNALLR